MAKYDCDVFIIGSGIAGSILGSILARNGADVMLIDAGSHPRFAIGESPIPHFLARLQMLATRYRVPELTTLESITRIEKNISSNFGVKKHFGFVHHRPGAEPDPKESAIFGLPKTLYRAAHIFRQDSDSYLFQVAIKHGCKTRQNWRVADVAFGDDVVTITGVNGEQFAARYLVDAGGFRSPVADKLELREQPCRFKTHTRSVFNLLLDVPPFDDMLTWDKQDRPPVPWHEGTLHHTFEHAWMWVIPFSNHKGSTNPLTSVGLVLDPRHHPKPEGLSPEAEFHRFISDYPAVRRHFKNAKGVREWVSTGRLQYGSKRTVGHRWCLMSHAAGFIDPLLSRGLSNTLEVIDAVAWRLLDSLRDDDFSEERYEYVERLQQGLLDYNDDVVNALLLGFPHYRLWHTIMRIVGYSSNFGAMRLNAAQHKYQLTGDQAAYKALESPVDTGFWWPDDPEMKRIWDMMIELTAKFEVGEISGDEAGEQLLRRVIESDLTPDAFGYKDPESQHLDPKLQDVAKLLLWSMRSGPPNVKELATGTFRGIGRAALRGKKRY
jgi:tetracycline 7-halogenase / FADH2 O2-dependent halogenase